MQSALLKKSREKTNKCYRFVQVAILVWLSKRNKKRQQQQWTTSYGVYCTDLDVYNSKQ